MTSCMHFQLAIDYAQHSVSLAIYA